MRPIHCIVFIAVLVACKPSGPPLKPLDLLSEGLPLKINAPEDVEVSSSDLGIMKDVTVKNNDGYSIQIFESEAYQLDLPKAISTIKSKIEGSKYFSKIISEDEGGFLFEKKVDDSYINYDFRHVKIRGDKQYVIQAGMSSKHTLDQVKSMYESVQ